MDRKEFCVLMAKAKQESGRGTSDISFENVITYIKAF